MLKEGGGAQQFWGSFSTVARGFNHTDGGWGVQSEKKFPPFKRGSRKVLSFLERGGGRKKFRTHNFPIL